MMVKDSLKTPQPSQCDAESILPAPSVTGSVDGARTHEEGLQSISLSSDEGSFAAHAEGDEMLECEDAMGMGTSRTFERRADKFKRNSLKKVDSLKKAFSRQSIEKKMTQITTKIVPPEKREKIKKSLTPNHPKSPTTKSSSFKVSPMTFNVKKVRDGEAPTQVMSSPEEGVHVEIPPLGRFDGEIPSAEMHTDDAVFEVSPTSPESMKLGLAINGESPSIQHQFNGNLADLAVPEDDEDVGVEDEEEEEEEEKEQHKSLIETAADIQISSANAVEQVIPTATLAVEQSTSTATTAVEPTIAVEQTIAQVS